MYRGKGHRLKRVLGTNGGRDVFESLVGIG